MTELKRCQRCQEIKDESQFRYIQYFQKYRSICKRCETVSRQERKRSIEKHVQEHGVTPAILERIHSHATIEANKRAKEAVFSKFDQKKKILYWLSKRALSLCYGIIFFLTFFLLLSIREALSVHWMILLLVNSVAVTITVFIYKPVRTVDNEISDHYRLIRERLFQDALRERI